MITDEKIIKIAPILIKNIPHTTIILTNEKYNEMHNPKTNMNAIKAILHNKVLYNLLKIFIKHKRNCTKYKFYNKSRR